MAGLPADAVKHYSEALQVCPNYAQAMYNMAVAHADTSHTEKARMYYEQCLQHNSSHVEAWCNLGVLHRNAGNPDLAMRAYEKALSCNPNYELAKSNLAVALCEKGTEIKHVDPKLAKKLYKRALALQPCFSDAHYNLGVLYAETGKFERALLSYNLAVQFNPRLTEAHNNLGVVHKELGNMHKALECYKRALQCDRQHHQTHNNIAVVYTLLGDIDSASEHLRTANAISPHYAEAYNNIGVLLRDQGDIDLAINHYEQCYEIDARADMAAQNRLHALNYSEHWSKARVYEAHVAWGTAFQKRIDDEIVQAANGSQTDNPIAVHLLRCLENAPRPDASRPRGPNTDSPLRIGYLSPDFFTHSVSYFAEVLLQKYDATGFEVYAYANVAQPDPKTVRFQKLLKDRWRNIWGLTASAAAKLIVEDKIDILVELAGHTANNRLDIMALRLAPVQVTWIGYPNTTGLKAIDYRVTDGTVDPLNTSQQFSERLWRLPDVFLCYTPSLEAPEEPSEPPLQSSGGIVTFGSFNVLAKVQSRTIRLWASILKRVPNSRLLLKAKPFATPTAKKRMEELFVKQGVCPERLDLVPLIPSTKSHLQVYSHVDVGLDPFPYAGTTTTCEAMFMGVPVITMGTRSENGDHAHNVGVSLLTVVGHPELVAYTDEEYIEKAVSLGTDLPRLKAIRSSLRTDMMGSALGQGDRYMMNVEKMFCGMWEEKGGKIVEEGNSVSLTTKCEEVLSDCICELGDDSVGSTPPCRSTCESSDEEESVKDALELGANTISKENPNVDVCIANESSVATLNK
ncbi:O-GlcNAc transferase [Gracilaria domingensis]|nr:O-GlcNAc transferase [Gracilaria domingensis]